MKYIFIDTNIFLHCQDFEKIDWLKEASTNCCKLIVSPIVINELDEKKIGNNRVSNKARNVLNRFEQLMENENVEIKNNVFFGVLPKKPSKNIYEENDLNFDEQDHRLIASIIEFRQNENIDDIELCTNDIGPRLSAKQFGIKSLKLNDKYLLPNQESEEEKRIKILEQENRALRIRIPELSLSFSNSKEFFNYQVHAIQKFNLTEFKSQKMNEIKAKHPHIEPIDPFKNPQALLFQLNLSLTQDQINSYNKSLDEFYANYEKALIAIFDYDQRERLTYELNIALNNNGSCPADDIDIHLHFPDGFELFESTEIKRPNKLPDPPRKPKNRIDFDYSSAFISRPYIPSSLKNIGNINFNSPTIKKTNSYNVDYYRKNLKHGYVEELESLSIVFDSFTMIKNFAIEYEISAGNMPVKLNGQLNVIFNK